MANLCSNDSAPTPGPYIPGIIDLCVPAGAGLAPMKCGVKTGTIHVLVVEDCPADIYLIRASLSMGEIPKYLSVVTDGEEALDFLTRTGQYHNAPRPDLILLDLNLPKWTDARCWSESKRIATCGRFPCWFLAPPNPTVISAARTSTMPTATSPSPAILTSTLISSVRLNRTGSNAWRAR